MRSIFIKFLLLFLGVIVAVILAEIALRILSSTNIIPIDKKKSFANDAFIYSSTLKYTIKPYLTRDCSVPGNLPAVCYSNKYGFRDKDYDFNKPSNTYRILLLGDSLTYGPGVNSKDTYPRIFEQIVKNNNKTNKKIEIINMGMIFYGPQQYYNLYLELGKKYKPDLIILSFHLLTDPYDAYEYNENKKTYLLKSIPDKIPYTISQSLKEHSYITRMILSAYYGWVNRQEIPVEKNVFHGQKNRYQYDTQLNTSSPAMKKGWEISEKYVNALIKAAASNGSKIVIVAFPTPAQIIPDEWKIMKEKGYVSDKNLYENSQTRKKLITLCLKNKWICLDLQNDLRKSKNPRKLFLIGDIHLTHAGNTITANAIYNFVINKVGELK